jgi:hypothetical protein
MACLLASSHIRPSFLLRSWRIHRSCLPTAAAELPTFSIAAWSSSLRTPRACIRYFNLCGPYRLILERSGYSGFVSMDFLEPVYVPRVPDGTELLILSLPAEETHSRNGAGPPPIASEKPVRFRPEAPRKKLQQ